MIITGRYLEHGSDSMVLRASIRTHTVFPLSGENNSVKKMKKTCRDITYGAGSNLILSCKGISKPQREEKDHDDVLTLPNAKNITSRRCEVNMKRK